MRKISLFVSFFILLSQSAQGFVVISNSGKPARWEDNLIRYQLYNIPDDFVGAIRESFQVWTEVDGVNIAFDEDSSEGAPGSRDGRNSIAWIDEDWGELSFNPPSNALAVTLSSFDSGSGAIIDADIYFNAENFDWAVIEDESDFDKVDVQNIATHEIGHMIGLDHSSISFFETDPELYEATMFYASGAGETARRVPQTDDQKGVRSLYPANRTATPTIEEVQEIESAGSVRIYRVKGTNFNQLTSFVLTADSGSIYDVVARYRTIVSSTEAEIELNLGSFFATEGQLVAFNHPGELGTIQMNVQTGLQNATSQSGGGGGGCSVATNTNSSSVDLAWIVLAVFTLGLLWRRSRNDISANA